jgi:hypothetical protein
VLLFILARVFSAVVLEMLLVSCLGPFALSVYVAFAPHSRSNGIDDTSAWQR